MAETVLLMELCQQVPCQWGSPLHSHSGTQAGRGSVMSGAPGLLHQVSGRARAEQIAKNGFLKAKSESVGSLQLSVH